MNGYIINPVWFYWLSVCNSLKSVVLAVAVLTAIVSGVFFVRACCEADYSDWQDEDVKKLLKSCRKYIIVALALFVMFAFVPSKDALIEMQVARFATYENAEWTVDAIKSAVDYIVEAIKSLK